MFVWDYRNQSYKRTLVLKKSYLVLNLLWVRYFNSSKITNMTLNGIIVMIDSITYSLCLRHYVQNGLSYLGEET